MSSNIIFKVPGRTTTYMPIDVNTPKEEIYNRYARASFSTDNEWPYESPSAGYYDIKNSDTKLILLNNQKTWSHLRGKTKPKKEPFVKDPNYDWVEKEIELKKAHEINAPNRGKKDKRQPDPVRHFLHTSCSYKVDYENESSSMSSINNSNKKSKSLPASRVRTATTTTGAQESTNNTSTNAKEERAKKESLDKAMLLKYLYSIGPRTTGYQNKYINSTLPREFTSSYNLNHPEFNNGQKLFLNNLCNVYSLNRMKRLKKEQYERLLDHQKSLDHKHRLKYRFNEGENFDIYENWFNNERPVQHQANCGYFSTKTIDPNLNNTSSSLRRAKSCKPSSDRQPRQYFCKSFDTKSNNNNNNESEIADSNEVNKKSNEDKLSDLNGTESFSSFPSPKIDSEN